MTAMTVDLTWPEPANTRGSADTRSPRSGVLERLTQILDAFAGIDQRLLLDDITVATGLPRSTAFRLLTQMVDLDWLEHDQAGYRLGQRATKLAGLGTDHSALRAAASDSLNILHLRTGGVAHLTVLDGSSVHYLDKVGGPALATVPSRVGARLRADSTASGLALLAGLEPENVDLLLGGRSNDLAPLHGQLSRIRGRHGVAETLASGCHLGIGVVAAPVLSPQGAIAAISVARHHTPSSDHLAPLVVLAARRTSEAMFPDWPGPQRGRRTPGGLTS